MRIGTPVPRTVRRLAQAAAALSFIAGLGVLPLAAPSGGDTPAPPPLGGPTPSYDPVAYDCTSQVQIPQLECEALVALYDSAGGPGWTKNTNWLATSEPCEWYGIDCAGGSVSVVDLYQNNLTGTIPAQLGNFSKLWFLRLDANHLTGTIPTELGNLSLLQTLHLENNQLTGQIPATLGSLSNLDSLRLDSNRLWGPIPTALGNLGKLTYLALTANGLSGSIPPGLGNLTGLTNLSLNWNRLDGTIPPELGNLVNLERLFLSNNKLSGAIPAALGNLGRLKWMVLVYNQLSGPIPPEFGKLGSLEWLALDNNPMSGPIPPELGNLPNLNRLNLGSIGASGPIPPELGNLGRLMWLGLGTNELTGAIPAELGKLSSLKELHLMENQLTGAVPAELGNLGNLEHLYLFGNQLSGEIPPALGNLSRLINLHLASNQLSGKIPPEFGNLVNLVHLWLGSNLLSGKIPSELGNLSYLEELGLDSNQLSGPIPPELGNLRALKSLTLNSNQLTGEIPATLGSLGGLEELSLYRNELGGLVPIEVASLGGAAPLSANCDLMPGNWGLYMLDTPPYTAADQDGDGFICELGLTAAPVFSKNPVKEIVDLGTLGGSSFARAVNPEGIAVVGGSFAPDGLLHPFLWIRGRGMIDLGTPFPGLNCEARAIDASGGTWGVGTCCDVFNPATLECEGEVSRAFEFKAWGSGWVALPSLATEACVAASANSAGWSEVGGGCRRLTEWQMNATRWTPFQASGQFLMDYPHERYSAVKAHTLLQYPKKNAKSYLRQYAGTFETHTGDRHAFITRSDMMPLFNDLGTLGGSFSDANAMNESGYVVGVSETASGERHAFGWSPNDRMFDLGTIGLGKMSVATGINRSNDVVGYAEAYATVVGFVRLQGVLIALPPPDGARGWAALGISNKGHVVGAAAMPEPGSPLRATMWVLK